MTAICGVEKLELQPRSQFRRPLAVFDGNFLRGSAERPSLSAYNPLLGLAVATTCVDATILGGSETFLAPQFPDFFNNICAFRPARVDVERTWQIAGRVHSQYGSFP